MAILSVKFYLLISFEPCLLTLVSILCCKRMIESSRAWPRKESNYLSGHFFHSDDGETMTRHFWLLVNRLNGVEAGWPQHFATRDTTTATTLDRQTSNVERRRLFVNAQPNDAKTVSLPLRGESKLWTILKRLFNCNLRLQSHTDYKFGFSMFSIYNR